MAHESDCDTNCKWCNWCSHQMIDSRTGGLGGGRSSGDHPDNNIVGIGRGAEKSPGGLGATCSCSGSSGGPSAGYGVKNSQMVLSPKDWYKV